MKAVSTKDQKAQGGDLLVSPTPATIAEAIVKRQSVMAVAMDVGYTQIAEALPDVLNAVIEKAKDGNMTAARLILERILPVQSVADAQGGDKQVHVNITVSQAEPRPMRDIFDVEDGEDGETVQ